VPDCAKLGLNPGIDLSCAKKIAIGDPVPGVCGPGEQADAGLCYPSCKPGYKGIGPVCWGGAPPGWVECGMGAAKDAKTCASIVFNQVGSVGKLAMTIASLGESDAVQSAASGPANASKLPQLKDQFNKMKAAYEAAKKKVPALQKAEDTFKTTAQGRPRTRSSPPRSTRRRRRIHRKTSCGRLHRSHRSSTRAVSLRSSKRIPTRNAASISGIDKHTRFLELVAYPGSHPAVCHILWRVR
jgi:hypothetical protein